MSAFCISHAIFLFYIPKDMYFTYVSFDLFLLLLLFFVFIFSAFKGILLSCKYRFYYNQLVAKTHSEP